jgi:hypothetical protein
LRQIKVDYHLLIYKEKEKKWKRGKVEKWKRGKEEIMEK